MLFVRFFLLLLLPIRLPFILLGRLLRRGGKGVVADQAASVVASPTVGAVGKVAKAPDLVDVRYGVFFKIFSCPESDEPVIGPNDVTVAGEMYAKAQEYYKVRPDLFPTDDIFYEEVEEQFIDKVSRIDNAGGKDQFVDTLTKARKITNDNTRMLACELAPLALMLLLFFHGAMLIFDPFNLLVRDSSLLSLEGAQVFAADVGLAGAAVGVGVAFVALVYWFSYTHIQRANALSLNVFITTEFARLNNSFRVAQREALQAETQLADTQKDELRKLASGWALSYHWIGVRQFLEEMIVRNNMFQIRRNTTLYLALGVVVCVGVATAAGIAVMLLAANLNNSHTPWPVVLAHVAVVSLAFIFVAYGLTLRKPFAIVATSLMKDQWYRYDTLSVGDAIAEQVTRDKVQIVINRDRARAAGV